MQFDSDKKLASSETCIFHVNSQLFVAVIAPEIQ